MSIVAATDLYTAERGQNVKLRFNIDRMYPTSPTNFTVTWFKDNRVIVVDEHKYKDRFTNLCGFVSSSLYNKYVFILYKTFSFVHNHRQSYFELTVVALMKSDEGEYGLQVTNRDSEDQASTQLQVTCKSDVTRTLTMVFRQNLVNILG